MIDLPSGWTEVNIEDVLAPLEDGRTIHQGWSPQCEKEPSDNDDSWGVLKTTSIQWGAFLPEHNKRLPDKLTPRPLLEVRQGDVLITCAGPRARCGVACLVRDTRPRLMLSGKMYRFRFDDRLVDPRFAEAYLLSDAAVRAIDRMKTGTSESGLNLTHGRFRKLRIPLPSPSEQQRIVDAIEEQLSRLAAAAEMLRRAEQQLKHLRRAALQAAFASLPVSSLGGLLREPLRNGKSARASARGGIRVLTLTAITKGDFSARNTKLVDLSPGAVRSLTLESGDIFIQRSNTAELVGTARMYDGPSDWAIFPDLLIRVRLGKDVIPRFAELALQSPALRQYFRSRAQGVAGSMPKIDQSTVMDAPLPIAPIAEQRTIVADLERQFSIADAMASAIVSTNRRRVALRQTILRDAFAGRLLDPGLPRKPHSARTDLVRAETATV